MEKKPSRVLSLLTLIISIMLLANIVFAASSGLGTFITIETEDFVPMIWLGNSRVVLDDNLHPGRISGAGDFLQERTSNYAFEGEQIVWDVLVLDLNGIEKIEDVFITVGPEQANGEFIETNCNLDFSAEELMESVILGADRLVQLQADITEDNAGNGDPDTDPDDGGWDWTISSAATEHSATTSSGNLYGVTALGIIAAEQIETKPEYLVALEDVYTETLAEYLANPANPRIRSAPSIPQLIETTRLTGDPKYADLAEDLYIAITTVKYTSPTDLAETIRNIRGGSGYDGLVPWDIAAWVEAAVMLDEEFPGNGYDQDAIDMAEVIYDDMDGTPGYFIPSDDQEPYYILGLTGGITAYQLTGTHLTGAISVESLTTTLLDLQQPDGSWGWGWDGADYNWDDPDLQNTAYAVLALSKVSGGIGVLPARAGANWLVTQQNPNGGWDYSGTEYPEIDGESVTAIGGRIVGAMQAALINTEFGEYNPEIMQWYLCILTIESPASMHGEYWITANVVDVDDQLGTMDENEFWFLNPVIAVTIGGTPINFGVVRPGTVAYSNTLTVGNGAELGSGVMMDMFITGTDFTDSAHSGAKCPTTNQLSLANMNYFATNGFYDTLGLGDVEGYLPIVYGDSFSQALYGVAEMIPTSADPEQYSLGNVLSPGSEVAVTFRLSLPEPCNGDFTDGNIYFWGEAI